MATVQVEELLEGKRKKLDIVNLVNYDTWKELLMELVEKEKLDPWDIDIVKVVDSYIAAVKELKIMDLRIPANIILAASILLRLKSEMLTFGVVEEPVEEAEAPGRSPPLVDDLSLRLRPPMKRKLTLDELISALDEAMKIKEERMLAEKEKPFEVPIYVKNSNIEEEMEILYKEMGRHADKEKLLTFSHLMEMVDGRDALLELFIPMIFLANKQRIALAQEKFFGEIIIRILG